MDEVAGKAKQMEAEVYLIGGQGILAEVYLRGVQGLKPEEAGGQRGSALRPSVRSNHMNA